jgi:hypothetical protein
VKNSYYTLAESQSKLRSFFDAIDSGDTGPESDYQRLLVTARQFAGKNDGPGLLNEAFLRIANGRRRSPREVDMVHVVTQIKRSIRDWPRTGQRGSDELASVASKDDLESRIVAKDQLSKARANLQRSEDEKVFDLILNGYKRKDIMMLLGLEPEEYDVIMRRIRKACDNPFGRAAGQ